MPKIAYSSKYEFYIVSADLNDNRMQINVLIDGYGNNAKFWLEPMVSIAIKNDIPLKGNLTWKQVGECEELIERNLDKLIKQFKDFQNGKKIKSIFIK